MITQKDVAEFSDHCVFIRSVYLFAMRIWRDSDHRERQLMESTAQLFFEDMGQVLREYIIISACRITDPASSGGYENFTVETFSKGFSSDPSTFKQLEEFRQRMLTLREKILPARNKLAAHADRETIRAGKPLGAASFAEWDAFWSALSDFVRLINEKTIGRPFEINAGGVLGDAEMLLRAFRQSQLFESWASSGQLK
jgi:hypothetical protein